MGMDRVFIRLQMMIWETVKEKLEMQIDYWSKNNIQFPRLLAEIRATGSLDPQILADAMGLGSDDIDELFDRAQIEWEDIKQSVWEQTHGTES